MIGEPTNFIHTGHIGQRDVENSEEKLVVVWNQMRSKGGYSMSYQVGSCLITIKNGTNLSLFDLF